MEKIQIPEKKSKELMGSIVALKNLIFDEDHMGTVVRLMEQTTSFDKDLNKLLISHGFSPSDKKAVPEWNKLVGNAPESYKISPESRALILGGIEAFIKSFIRENKLSKLLSESSESSDLKARF